MAKIAATVWLCLLVIVSGAARADDKPASTLPARVETHHSIELAGQRLGYDAIAETFTLTDRKGAPTATIFTVSYLAAAPAGSLRPVSFVLNGGPGAASVFLHLGALGPKMMQTPPDGEAPSPPVQIIDNPATWLPFPVPGSAPKSVSMPACHKKPWLTKQSRKHFGE